MFHSNISKSNSCYYSILRKKLSHFRYLILPGALVIFLGFRMRRQPVSKVIWKHFMCFRNKLNSTTNFVYKIYSNSCYDLYLPNGCRILEEGVEGNVLKVIYLIEIPTMAPDLAGCTYNCPKDDELTCISIHREFRSLDYSNPQAYIKNKAYAW